MKRFWFGTMTKTEKQTVSARKLALETLESRFVPASDFGTVTLAPVRDLVSQHSSHFLLNYENTVPTEEGSFLVDFGDGSPREILAPRSGNASLPISHSFSDPGAYQTAVYFQPASSDALQVLVETAVEVKQVGLIEDPQGGNLPLLALGGTSNDDTIEIQALDGIFLSAKVNGNTIPFPVKPDTFDLFPTREIAIKTGDGDDFVTLGIAQPQGLDRIIIHDVVSELISRAQVDLGSGVDRLRMVPLGSVGTPRKGGPSHVDFQFVNQGSYYGRPKLYTDHFLVSHKDAESVTLNELPFGGPVANLYQSILTRQPSLREAAYWSGQIQRHGFSFVARSIFFSLESTSKTVRQWYQQFLGRTVTNQEASPWIGQLMAGKSMETVLAHFLASGEFVNRFSRGSEIEQKVAYVETLYRLLLNREATQTEIATQLSPQAGPFSFRALAESFLRCAEYRSQEIQTDYLNVMQRGRGAGPGYPDPSPFFTPAVSMREVHFWTVSSWSLRDIRYRFITSPEFLARTR